MKFCIDCGNKLTVLHMTGAWHDDRWRCDGCGLRISLPCSTGSFGEVLSYHFQKSPFKNEEVAKEQPAGDWYVADRNHKGIRLRGPYSTPAIAAAVRAEMERNADSDQNKKWNLWVESV